MNVNLQAKAQHNHCGVHSGVVVLPVAAAATFAAAGLHEAPLPAVARSLLRPAQPRRLQLASSAHSGVVLPCYAGAQG